MFRENKTLRELHEKRRDSGSDLEYREKAYEELPPDIEEEFQQKRKKELGFSFVEGAKESSLLISSAHAVDFVGTNLKVEKKDVDLMNQSEGVRERYIASQEGELLIGKTYQNAAKRENREAYYKADSNTALLGVELQTELSGENQKDPSLLLYEMPQVFSEPNKVDAEDRNLPVVDLDFYSENGMQKMRQYILESGVNSISSEEIKAVKKGEYSELAEAEDNAKKRDALLECEEVMKAAKVDGEKYKEISASLGVLKIHRSYYEKQEELLYSNPKAQFPVNLELHTAFDELKKEEGFDVVIGSKFGSSVSDPETEFLLASILRKEGFVVNMSTLNNFPTDITEREKDGLKKTLEVSELYLEDSQRDFYSEAIKVFSREEMLDKLETIIDQRIDQFKGKEDSLIRFVEWKGMAMLVDKGETFEALRSLVKEIFLQEISALSDNDLKLLLQQNLINLLLAGKTHDDRLRGGLTGLSSLQSKFDSKEKYEKEYDMEIRPQIMQLEVAASVMKDPEKRNQIKKALTKFGDVVQSKDFNPKKKSKNII